MYPLYSYGLQVFEKGVGLKNHILYTSILMRNELQI